MKKKILFILIFVFLLLSIASYLLITRSTSLGLVGLQFSNKPDKEIFFSQYPPYKYMDGKNVSMGYLTNLYLQSAKFKSIKVNEEEFGSLQLSFLINKKNQARVINMSIVLPFKLINEETVFPEHYEQYLQTDKYYNLSFAQFDEGLTDRDKTLYCQSDSNVALMSLDNCKARLFHLNENVLQTISEFLGSDKNELTIEGLWLIKIEDQGLIDLNETIENA